MPAPARCPLPSRLVVVVVVVFVFLRCSHFFNRRIARSIDPGKNRVFSSHGVLARPLLRQLLVPPPIGLVDLRDLRHERIVRVRIREQRADGQEDFRDRQRGAPLLL
eukprot:30947-Pelagococcus_subviridis.AAC.5